MRGVAQPGSASALGAEGRWFESSLPDHLILGFVEGAMIEVRIFQPTKSVMQSGRNNTKKWVLEFEPTEPRRPDALMGWIGSGDTRQQVRLNFDNLQDAVAYAEKHALSYYIQPSQRRHILPKNYSDNFNSRFRFEKFYPTRN